MTLALGIGAGAYKTAKDTPLRLLDTVSSVTYGSFCSTKNTGNADIPTDKTEIWDLENLTSLNAKGLPNQGLEAFLRDELPLLLKLFKDKLAKIRVSVSPRKAGELSDMVDMIKRYKVWDLFILEVNLACPNHRNEAGLSPILARDPDAVEERLAEMSDYPGVWEIKISTDGDYTLLNRLVLCATKAGAHGIVSGNTRPGTGELAGKKLHPNVGGGGLGGAILLDDTVRRTRELKQLIQGNQSKLIIRSCGGATGPRAIHHIQKFEPVEIQAVSIPYFLGEKAMQQLVMDSH
jgi:dihydroorotate dehydrogenase